jgi:membrane protease YdiL (CAAX protease family)
VTPPPVTGFARRAEIWLVLWVCGGLSIVTSLVRLFDHQTGTILFTTPRLLGTVGVEVCFAIAFVPFLRATGWRLTDMTLPFQILDILRGIALWTAAYAIYWMTGWGAHAIGPAAVALFTATRFRSQASLAAVVLASVVNPLFEEFFYFGYAFTALRRYSVRAAFVVAVCLRVAIHLYQGWLALVYFVPLAILFTFYFSRSNRIWPVIVAHAIQDFVALAFLSTHATSQ